MNFRFFGKIATGFFIVFFLTTLAWIERPATVYAQDDPADDTPAFSNPAQAAHAAALADEASTQPDEQVAEALADVQDAKDALSALEADPDATQEDIDAAEEAVAEKEAAAAEAVAERVGAITADISAMRDDGMGWGQIAHELGVHPGALGLGHVKGKAHRNRHSVRAMTGEEAADSELAEATARNTKTGLALGHGVNKGGSNKGIGLAGKAAKGQSGKGGSSSGGGGKGKGAGASNSGGNSGKGGK